MTPAAGCSGRFSYSLHRERNRISHPFLTSFDIYPSAFAEKDVRRNMPRFQEMHFSENRKLLPEYRAIAEDAGSSPAQLALAWVLQRGGNMHVIPGTTLVERLDEDFVAAGVDLCAEVVRRVDTLVNQKTVSGPRYVAVTQAQIDTEVFE